MLRSIGVVAAALKGPEILIIIGSKQGLKILFQCVLLKTGGRGTPSCIAYHMLGTGFESGRKASPGWVLLVLHWPHKMNTKWILRVVPRHSCSRWPLPMKKAIAGPPG